MLSLSFDAVVDEYDDDVIALKFTYKFMIKLDNHIPVLLIVDEMASHIVSISLSLLGHPSPPP